MIIVSIRGGLGNQLFQYAFGRSLSEHYGVPLKLDFKNVYPDVYGRSLELESFECKVTAASEKEIMDRKWQKPTFFQRLRNRLFGKIELAENRTYFREKEWFIFDPNVYNDFGDSYMSGFWQSWKYFEKHEKLIRSELRPIKIYDEAVLDLSIPWAGRNTVSVHFRRKDYVEDSKTASVFDVVNQTYYQKAFEIISSNISDPLFILFCDDYQWITRWLKGKLQVSGDFTIAPECNRPCMDMWLMSRCKNHIIVNSSFSWWGAWLNPSPDKLVIAPNYWTTKTMTRHTDLLPANWNVTFVAIDNI